MPVNEVSGHKIDLPYKKRHDENKIPLHPAHCQKVMQNLKLESRTDLLKSQYFHI
jgi:hypothetical protein